MENKKAPNFFFGLIATILGVTLFKHFDFQNLKFEKPALDVVYLVVFSISVYYVGKKFKKQRK